MGAQDLHRQKTGNLLRQVSTDYLKSELCTMKFTFKCSFKNGYPSGLKAAEFTISRYVSSSTYSR